MKKRGTTAKKNRGDKMYIRTLHGDDVLDNKELF